MNSSGEPETDKLTDSRKAFHSSKHSFWECFTHPAYTDSNIVFKDGLLPVNKACLAALSNTLKFCIEDVHDSIIVPDLSIHSFDDVLLTFTEHSIANYGELGPGCFTNQFHQTLELLGINLFKSIENYNDGFSELTKKMKRAQTNLQKHLQKEKSKSFYCDPLERTAISLFGPCEENKYNSQRAALEGEGKLSERTKKAKVRAIRAGKYKVPKLFAQTLYDPSKTYDDLTNAEFMKTFLFCDTCGTNETFFTAMDLETHMRKQHKYDGVIMTCTFCQCPCMGEEAVAVHEQTLCRNKENQCVYCGVKHTNRQTMLDHMLEGHGNGKKIYCYICKTYFTVLKANYVPGWPHLEFCLDLAGDVAKPRLLLGNEKDNSEYQSGTVKSFGVKCSNCLIECTSIKSINDHFERKSSCRRDEKNSELFSFLEQLSHTNVYNCEECGVSFKEEEWLERHTATHRAQLEYFDCKQDHCKFKFVTELALDLHTNSFHPDAKLECSICKSMVPKGDFKDHVISHAVQCKQCDKIFAHTGVLNNHILSVHDEKNKRIQKLKRKKLDEETTQQRHQINITQTHETVRQTGEVSQDLRNPEPLMNPIIQSDQNQMSIAHPSLIRQQPYQQSIEVPLSHIQNLNVNQMSHFLQINNPQGQVRFQQ